MDGIFINFSISCIQQQTGGSSGMIVDVTSNEKAVHGDFYNSI